MVIMCVWMHLYICVYARLERLRYHSFHFETGSVRPRAHYILNPASPRTGIRSTTRLSFLYM